MKKVIYHIDGTRFGNHLYFYLFAYSNDFQVRYLQNMDYWNNFFPKLRTFISYDTNVLKITPPYDYYQNYKKYFSTSDLNNFIQAYMEDDLKELIFKNALRYDLIINIRRGDFYSSDFINFYGFNLVKYIDDTIKLINKDVINSVGIISDDIDWCRNNLNLSNNFNCPVDYLNLSPIESFMEIIKSRTIIITNSTFSYWASYINNYLYDDSTVYAPNFNTYFIDRGEQVCASETWNLIDVETYYKSCPSLKLKIKMNIRQLKLLIKKFWEENPFK